MEKTILKLKMIKKETPLVSSLTFETEQKIVFKAGQYFNVTIPELMSHGKAYTIASAPIDNDLVLTIKKQGKFSSALLDLKVGNEIFVDGPEGYFFDNFSADKKNVFVVGGIGITPFMSLIRDYVNNSKSLGDLVVLYSNKFKNEITFFDELTKLSAQEKIKLVNFITQEKVNDCEIGRINAELIKKLVNDCQNRNYYLCGSISFVNDMWKMIGGLGVPEEQIFTEAFF